MMTSTRASRSKSACASAVPLPHFLICGTFMPRRTWAADLRERRRTQGLSPPPGGLRRRGRGNWDQSHGRGRADEGNRRRGTIYDEGRQRLGLHCYKDACQACDGRPLISTHHHNDKIAALQPPSYVATQIKRLALSEAHEKRIICIMLPTPGSCVISHAIAKFWKDTPFAPLSARPTFHSTNQPAEKGPNVQANVDTFDEPKCV